MHAYMHINTYQQLGMLRTALEREGISQLLFSSSLVSMQKRSNFLCKYFPLPTLYYTPHTFYYSPYTLYYTPYTLYHTPYTLY